MARRAVGQHQRPFSGRFDGFVGVDSGSHDIVLTGKIGYASPFDLKRHFRFSSCRFRPTAVFKGGATARTDCEFLWGLRPDKRLVQGNEEGDCVIAYRENCRQSSTIGRDTRGKNKDKLVNDLTRSRPAVLDRCAYTTQNKGAGRGNDRG